RRLGRHPPVTLLDVFQEQVRRRPQHLLLRFQEQLFTYREADSQSNRLARGLLKRLGQQPGRAVAVLLPNRPIYVWTWLALAKLGWPMACLNWNARGRALRHAVATARATVLLAGDGEWSWGGFTRVSVAVHLSAP
ncbi:S27A2 synthetase, partial [Halcyon senegalensis]|nr:S27A2 synthetase [Halcyon senegalensis]